MVVKYRFIEDTSKFEKFFPKRDYSNDTRHQPKHIVAIDSEGKTDSSTGDHHIDLIAAVSSAWQEYLWATGKELTTDEIMEFLLGLPERYGEALFVIYSGSYDFNMWLKRLSDMQLYRLNKRGYCRHGPYEIKVRFRKEIIIRDRRTKYFSKNHPKYRRQIHIYDVFGFFQRSFVKALEKWKVADQATIDRIESMKILRGMFENISNNDILEYCLEENRLLVDLTERLRQACWDAGLKPKNWFGAGALASALLTKYHVKEYMAPAPNKMYEAAWAKAYYGGRTEVTYQGRFENGFHYDINSAYPTAMVSLPCLAHGTWHYTNDGSLYEKYKYSIWNIEWNCHGELWGPFPWRHESGRIFYPDTAEGWYHKVEIEAASNLYPNSSFTIHQGIYFIPGCNHQPFKFIEREAAYRLKLKADKHPAAEPLKLGLNSLYGKLAQQLGKAPYQNFYWAGLVTATTRARLLDAIRCCKGTVYSVATDGIISDRKIDELVVGEQLGTWTLTPIKQGFLIKPGVYEWEDDKGEWHFGTRGFMKDEIAWQTLEDKWDSKNIGHPYEYETTRFYGLSQALMHGEDWRQYFGKWITEPRGLWFLPSLGTREWDCPDVVNLGYYRRGKRPRRPTIQPIITDKIVRLKLTCACNNNSFVRGCSAMFKHELQEGADIASIIRASLDDDQP